MAIKMSYVHLAKRFLAYLPYPLRSPSFLSDPNNIWQVIPRLIQNCDVVGLSIAIESHDRRRKRFDA